MSQSLRARAHNLVNTSVQDMQSGLYAHGVQDIPMLKIALQVADNRGEKTKAKILASKIKQLEKKPGIKVKVTAKRIELSVEVEK